MSEVAELKAKQDAMAEDIVEVKQSLRDIAKALNALAALEEKHSNTQQTITRIHGKIDDHENRIRANEVKMAAQMWVERVVWVVVAGIISGIVATFGG